MLKKTIAILCVLALAAALFSACAKKDAPAATAEPETEQTESTGGVTGSDATEGEVAEVDPEKAARFVGAWEGEAVRCVFNADGTGSVTDKETGTAVPFSYTLSASENAINVSFGSPDDTEKMLYSFTSVYSMSVKRADGTIIYLVRAAQENPLLGSWANAEVRYVFMSDGTGVAEEIETDACTAFEYRLDAEGPAFTIYFDGPDAGEAVTYELDEDAGTLTLRFADGTAAEQLAKEED